MPSKVMSRSVAAVGAAAVLAAGIAAAQSANDHPFGHFVHRVFERLAALDTNGDRRIDESERLAAAAERAAAVDFDQDGFISAAEVEAHRAREREAEIEARLARADSNGDGRTSAEEFAAAAAARLDRLDRNGDGFIDGADRRQSRHGRGGRGG